MDTNKNPVVGETNGQHTNIALEALKLAKKELGNPNPASSHDYALIAIASAILALTEELKAESFRTVQLGERALRGWGL